METKSIEDLERCTDLSHRFGYDLNHNLKYLALKKTILKYGIKELLNIGCGKGVVEFLLPDDIECQSIDTDRGALDVAININAQKRNRAFKKLDLFQLSEYFNGKKFKAVLISEVIEHLKEDEKALKVVRKILQPNGLFFLTVPNRDRFRNRIRQLLGRKKEFMVEDHLREYSLDEILKKLDKLGFLVLDLEGIYWGFPKEEIVRRFISPYHPFRFFLAKRFPQYATYFLLIAKMKGTTIQKDEKKKVRKKGDIFLVTPSFPPVGGGRGIRWIQFIRFLAQKGWKFDVLTIDPFVETDRNMLIKSLPPRVRILRTYPGPLYSLRKKYIPPKNELEKWKKPIFKLKIRVLLKGIYRKIFDPILIPDGMIEWLPFALIKGNQLIKENKYRLIITSAFPFSSHILGYLLKKRTKCFWIADYGDPWSIGHNINPSSLKEQINRRLESNLLKWMDRIIVTNEATKNAYLKNFPFLSDEKICVIGQGFDEELYHTIEPNTSNKFRIVYTGIFYNKEIRNHHPFFESLKSLSDLNLEIVIAGDVSTEDREIVRSQNLEEIVQFLGPIPHTQAISYQKGSTILLLIGDESPLQIPGKTFEYFAAGRPILCVSENPQSLACQYVKQYNRGFISLNKSNEISKTIRNFFSLWKSGN
ncbi:methyltransferase domain-containing protein, partial [candidate division TA06 bacterium]|nr:methyltransferase domain-containing protein [candidate division TA06 bacterium]